MPFLRNHCLQQERTDTLRRWYAGWLTRAALWASVVIFALARLAMAQTPSLTTIQQTLFAADGTRYNGSLFISWGTFDASGTGTVVQQSKTVPVVNGNLYVQLAPNATALPPANVYTVLYQSGGYQQYTETWTVPPSSTPLTIAQVRLAGATGNLTTGGVAAGNSTAITEAAVTGLVNDLQQRPVKGPSYANGAVAVIDMNGQIEAAAGTPGSCVMVDGTTGPCGSSGPSFVDAEIPGGAVNGTNKVFTLQNNPSGGSLMLFRNGMYMLAGSDYTLTGSTIQFAPGAIPQTGDGLVASYRLGSANAAPITSGSGGTSAQTTALPQILCSGAGASTAAAAWTQLGSCTIPAASLQSGNRIEIRFTVAHSGADSGFSFEIDWGATAIVSRQASAQELAVAAAAEAAIGPAASSIGFQSWGSTLPFAAGMVSAPAQSGVTLVFKAMMSAAGSDSVSLPSYIVLAW